MKPSPIDALRRWGSELLAGGPKRCPDCCWILPASPSSWAKQRALVIFFCIPLFLIAFVGDLVSDWERTQWPEVEGVVRSSVLEEHGALRLGRIEVAYTFGGRERSVSLRREADGQPVRTQADIQLEQAFVAAHAEGSRCLLRVDPREPTQASLDQAPRSTTLFLWLFCLTAAIGSCDTLATALWPKTVHAGCDLVPQRSGPGLDHREALSEHRILGPRTLATFLLACFVTLGALLFGRASLPWLGSLAALGAVFLVFAGRLVGEALHYWRWRKSLLVLEEPSSFRPPASYEARLSAPGGRVVYTLELRQERERWPLAGDSDDPGETPRWESKVLRSLPVDQVLGSGRQTRIRFSLPEDAQVPARWEGRERRRWVLRALQSGRDALFELDFTPQAPPEPRAREEREPPPSLVEIRRVATERIAATRPWPTSPTHPLGTDHDQHKLLLHGEVVWGRVVQAATHIFDPGPDDGGGVVAYSLNEGVGLQELTEAAQGLFDTKESPVDRLSQIMADEHTAFFAYPAPAWLSPPGRGIHFNTFPIPRVHLPERCLSNHLVPLLVAPAKTRAVMILPVDLWPDELQEWWLEK